MPDLNVKPRDSGASKSPIELLYAAMHRAENKVGGGEGLVGIYGSMTCAGTESIMNAMAQHAGLDHSSILVDIGSGLCRPLLHAAVQYKVHRTFGVELDAVKCQKAVPFLQHAVSQLTAGGVIVSKEVLPTIICTSVEQLGSLDPATHAYAAWEGFPVQAKMAVGDLFAATSSLNTITIVQRSLRNEDPAKVMADLGFGPMVLVSPAIPVYMAGSHRRLNAYMFTKASFLSTSGGRCSGQPAINCKDTRVTRAGKADHGGSQGGRQGSCSRRGPDISTQGAGNRNSQRAGSGDSRLKKGLGGGKQALPSLASALPFDPADIMDALARMGSGEGSASQARPIGHGHLLGPGTRQRLSSSGLAARARGSNSDDSSRGSFAAGQPVLGHHSRQRVQQTQQQSMRAGLRRRPRPSARALSGLKEGQESGDGGSEGLQGSGKSSREVGDLDAGVSGVQGLGDVPSRSHVMGVPRPVHMPTHGHGLRQTRKRSARVLQQEEEQEEEEGKAVINGGGWARGLHGDGVEKGLGGNMDQTGVRGNRSKRARGPGGVWSSGTIGTASTSTGTAETLRRQQQEQPECRDGTGAASLRRRSQRARQKPEQQPVQQRTASQPDSVQPAGQQQQQQQQHGQQVTQHVESQAQCSQPAQPSSPLPTPPVRQPHHNSSQVLSRSDTSKGFAFVHMVLRQTKPRVDTKPHNSAKPEPSTTVRLRSAIGNGGSKTASIKVSPTPG